MSAPIPTKPAKRKPGRPRTGKLDFHRGGWRVRHWVMRDGKARNEWFPLGTDNRAIAESKAAELLARIKAGEAVTASAVSMPETFEEAARRIFDERERDGMKSIADSRQRLRDYVFPVIGPMLVELIRASHVSECMDRAKVMGKSWQTIAHIKQDIRSVFQWFWTRGSLPEDPTDRAQIPKGLKKDERPRQLLTDAEFLQFITCAKVPALLRIMATVSRCLGGMRTSDLHAWRWEHIDIAQWTTARIRRPKNEKFGSGSSSAWTFVEMPGELAYALMKWWKTNGSPAIGPVFPVTRGPGYGSHRGHVSYAAALRKGLLAAGVTRPELHSSNDFGKRTDFHSFRRSYVSALGDAGANIQTAMKLSGHTKVETHMRYADAFRAARAPDGAIPALGAGPLETAE